MSAAQKPGVLLPTHHGRCWAAAAFLTTLLLWTIHAPQAEASGFADPVGSLWLKTSFLQWGSASYLFAGPSDRDLTAGVDIGTPIEFDKQTLGTLRTRSVALDVRFVPIEHLTLGIHVPGFQETFFEDTTFVSTTRGSSDIRTVLSYQITPNGSRVATTFNLRVKIPSAPLPDDLSEVPIPISEGQFDVGFEQVTTWKIRPALHLTVRTQARIRLEESTRNLKPGDEFVAGAEFGGAPWEFLWIKIAYQGLWGGGRENRVGRAFVTVNDPREVHDIILGAYINWGGLITDSLKGLAVDIWASHPFMGQNYPVGLTWSAGLAYQHTFDFGQPTQASRF